MSNLLYTQRTDMGNRTFVKDTRPKSEAVKVQDQFNWHSTFRDSQRNHYRTSYQDMIMQREVACKSDKPSGYGGHVANVGADVLFKNTEFNENNQKLKDDETRERLPDYEWQLAGVPVFCQNPRGARTQPRAKTIPGGFVVPPWAVEDADNPLSYRHDMTRYLKQMYTPRYKSTQLPAVATPRAAPATPMAPAAPVKPAVAIEPKAPTPVPQVRLEVGRPTTPRTYTPRPPSARSVRIDDGPPTVEESSAKASYHTSTSASGYILNEMGNKRFGASPSGSSTPRFNRVGQQNRSGAMTAR